MAQEWPSGWRTGRPIGWLAGCLCVAAGLAGSRWVAADRRFLGLAVCAVLATLALGVAAERALARAPVRALVGAATGMAVALLAHFGMALIYVSVSKLTGTSGIGTGLSGGVFELTGLSLLAAGGLTLPLGAAAAVVAGGQIRLRHRRTSPAGQNHS